MPRITFEWTGGTFSTDCERIAGMFARTPECFIPTMQGRIPAQARFALLRLLADADRADWRRGETFQELIDGIRIKVQHLKIMLP